MGRVLLDSSHVISLRVDLACLRGKVPKEKHWERHCRKGTEMVGATSFPSRIFIFEGGGDIWKKKKKMVRTKSFALTIKLVDPCIIH